MAHYILYFHGGSANHGCEALVRTTTQLLDYTANQITLASYQPNKDVQYGLDSFCSIHPMWEKARTGPRGVTWFVSYIKKRLFHNPAPLERYYICDALSAKKGDIAISIGGDNYCYNFRAELAKMNRVFRKKGLKTVLWGCSIEPSLLDEPETAADLSEFDLITAREAISYNALKAVNPHTILVADTAFLLNKKPVRLPENWCSENTIGINMSPMAEGCEMIPGMARRNYESLIDYCLKETDFNILLIPHVVIDGNDDRAVLRDIYEKYNYTGRLYMVDDADCETIKGYIAQCRFFVGARTHATIAAYSSIVPTLVLGYSVKSIGIAVDLFGTSDNFVIPVQKLTEESELKDAFIWVTQHEGEIRETLRDKIPEMQKRAMLGVEAVMQL